MFYHYCNEHTASVSDCIDACLNSTAHFCSGQLNLLFKEFVSRHSCMLCLHLEGIDLHQQDAHFSPIALNILQL